MLKRLLSSLRQLWSTNSPPTSNPTDTVTWSPAPTKETLIHVHREIIQGAVGSKVIPEMPPATNGPAESTKSSPVKKKKPATKSPSQRGKASTSKTKSGSKTTK